MYADTSAGLRLDDGNPYRTAAISSDSFADRSAGGVRKKCRP